MEPRPQIIAAINISRGCDQKSVAVPGYSSASKFRIEAKVFWAMRLTCLLCCFFAPKRATATVIVGFRTPTQVVIAADGLRGVVDDTGVIVKTIATCKIYAEGHGVYMTAGGVAFKAAPDIFVSFDEQLLDDTLGDPSISENVRRAITRFDATTRSAWRNANRVAPNFYSRVIAEHATQLIFGWIDNNGLGAASYSAIPQPDGSSSTPQWVIYPNDSVPSDTPFLWLTSADASTSTDRKLMDISNRVRALPANLPAFARSLIKDEIRADKAHRSVGHPIDVLVIDTKGTRWYKSERDSKCPPISPK